MGWLREIGDDPETQDMMNESAEAAEGAAGRVPGERPGGRPRAEILAEMRRVRATLTGDAAAYEEENERIAR